jgi:hypothetical protein
MCLPRPIPRYLFEPILNWRHSTFNLKGDGKSLGNVQITMIHAGHMFLLAEWDDNPGNVAVCPRWRQGRHALRSSANIGIFSPSSWKCSSLLRFMHRWAHLLKQQSSITVYCLPTKVKKLPFFCFRQAKGSCIASSFLVPSFAHICRGLHLERYSGDATLSFCIIA